MEEASSSPLVLSSNLSSDGAVSSVAAFQYGRATTQFATACCIVFIVWGVSGNLLTIVALSRSNKLRNATTAFVVSLCAADLLFCAINLPPTALRFMHSKWVLGETLCKLFPFFFYGNVAASLMSMTAITLNRYILINHYKHYDRIYQRKFVALMIGLCWLFSFSMLLPTLAGQWGQFGYEPRSFSCTILKKDGRSSKKFLFVLGFLLPCLIIVVSYSCIFYRVHKSRKNVEAHAAAQQQQQQAKGGPTARQLSHRQDEIRLTRMMLTIFCSFLLCFLPLMVVNVLEEKIPYPIIHVLASVFAWMSSCINPIIYAAMNRQYRQAYLRLFCGAKRRGPNSRSGSSHSKTLMSEVFAFNNAVAAEKPVVKSPIKEDNKV